MEHEQIRQLIQPYVDGETAPADARAVEEHLRACEQCRAVESGIRALHNALTQSAAAYRAPNQLQKNVRAALQREARGESRSFSPWLSFAAGVACALLLLVFVLLENQRAARNAIADQVVANHVRSLLAAHLVDVASSDQHTVKPWFNGKIDFAPEVQDFATDGFPLVGGRLDYLNGQTAVALVYRHNQHPINVLITPAPGRRDSSPSALTRRGYHLVHWTRAEMDYWAVSDLNADELNQFADHLRR